MAYKFVAYIRCLQWAVAAFVLAAIGPWCASARAQGYEVKPWKARAHTPAMVVAMTAAMVDLNGQTWRLADLRGKAVLMNFWASWCEPCRAEMPSLQALAQSQGPDKLVVLAVNYKEPSARIAQFVQRTGLTLPVVADAQGTLARQWGITIFPSTVLIGSDGRVRAVVRGEVDWGSAEATAVWSPLL